MRNDTPGAGASCKLSCRREFIRGRGQSLCDSGCPDVRAGKIGNDISSKERRRHTPDQIIRKLTEGNKLLASGQEPHG